MNESGWLDIAVLLLFTIVIFIGDKVLLFIITIIVLHRDVLSLQLSNSLNFFTVYSTSQQPSSHSLTVPAPLFVAQCAPAWAPRDTAFCFKLKTMSPLCTQAHIRAPIIIFLWTGSLSPQIPHTDACAPRGPATGLSTQQGGKQKVYRGRGHVW